MSREVIFGAEENYLLVCKLQMRKILEFLVQLTVIYPRENYIAAVSVEKLAGFL